MYRTMMMLSSALAFAIPLALSQPSAARPLATPAQPAEWCWGDCESHDEEEDEEEVDIDIEIDLELCVKAQTGTRAEACELRTGLECFAACSVEAVAPSCVTDLGAGARTRALASCEAERVELCRSQCDSGGAGFCERSPGHGLGKGHCKNFKNPGHPEHHDYGYDEPPGHEAYDPYKNDACDEKKDQPDHGDPVWWDVDICFILKGEIDVEG